MQVSYSYSAPLVISVSLLASLPDWRRISAISSKVNVVLDFVSQRNIETCCIYIFLLSAIQWVLRIKKILRSDWWKYKQQFYLGKGWYISNCVTVATKRLRSWENDICWGRHQSARLKVLKFLRITFTNLENYNVKTKTSIDRSASA